MSISTVFLFHDGIDGWHIEIDGLVFSQRQQFKKQFPETLLKNDECTLEVTPVEEPRLKEHQSKPPFQIVTSYLKQIAQSGYRVVSTDCTSDENGYRKTTLWTLQV